MKLRATLLLCGLLTGLAAAASAGDEASFSKTLATAEFGDAGLNKLSSDQLAILDALVRIDETTLLRYKPSRQRAAQFSQRLTAEQRASVGLSSLAAEDVAVLDRQVARLENPDASTATASTSTGKNSATDVPSQKRAPEIHGTISLLYGTGGHGYSAQGGAIDLFYHDPEHHYTISAGYAEFRVKGQFIRRDCPARAISLTAQ